MDLQVLIDNAMSSYYIIIFFKDFCMTNALSLQKFLRVCKTFLLGNIKVELFLTLESKNFQH